MVRLIKRQSLVYCWLSNVFGGLSLIQQGFREQGNAIIIKETILTEKDIHANMAWKIC